MPASIEHTASLVRWGPEHDGYGTPYTNTLTIQWLTPQWILIKGLDAIDKRQLRRMVREVHQMMGKLGVRKWSYQRRASGNRSRWVTTQVRNPRRT